MKLKQKMKVKKMRQLKKKSKVSLALLALVLTPLLSGCDQFSRFNHEKYDCGNNSTRINEILINKVKKGSNVNVTLNGVMEQFKINKVEKNEVYFNLKNKIIKINREDGKLTVKEDNKVIILECKILKFKM